MKPRRTGLVALALACGLTACQTPPPSNVTVFGLWPEQPPLRHAALTHRYEWPQLDAAQPELRWESFPRPGDVASDTNGLFAQFKCVTYDLRIWRGHSADELAGELVYARDAMPGTRHRVATPLPLNSWYFWTVRARFEVNGQTRVTEWSHIQSPEPPKGATAQGIGLNYPDYRYFRFYLRRARRASRARKNSRFRVRCQSAGGVTRPEAAAEGIREVRLTGARPDSRPWQWTR